MVNSPLDTRFFNIDVLVVRDEQVRGLGEVTKPNILEANSSRFEKDGLFSTDIFGPVGSDIRKVALGYIDLKVDTMHPHVWYNLLSLNSKYEDIIAGKVKAKYDIEKGDLVEDKVNGQTGYTYFLSVLPRIKFNDNGSDERRAKIAYVKKYCKQEYFSNKLLVLPAGLRDYRVDSSGKPMEDEVNTLYRRVLAITTLLKSVKVSDKNTEQLDPIRYKLQKSIGAIYEHFFGLIHGKEKFIQSKWSKRAIVNGTRNVLTPVPYKITNLNNNKITTNHTVCGLYQFIKAISPVTMNRVKTLFINKFLSPNSDTAMLVDGGTMRTTLARISVAKRDEWLSMEGLTKVMNKLKQPDLRFEPVVIDNHYLQLIYDNGRDIVLINNTDEITPDMKSEFIRPITYIEMFYIAIYDVKDKYPGFVTRYPVANLGGIYPCYIYVKTTFKSRTVNVTMDGRKIEMEEYPILGEDCMESVSASAQHIKGLSGDYDGDCCRGLVYARFNKKFYENYHNMIKNNKGVNMPCIKKHVMSNYGLIDLKSFPRSDLIKTKGNTDYYNIPDGVEVLTVWNGDFKWVKPTMFSIHKNLDMISVRTNKGNSVECSTDHTLVTLDENLNYKRVPAKIGMAIPRLKYSVDLISDKKSYKREITVNGTRFKLNKEFGYLIGAIIGDGWVNSGSKLNDIMLSSIYVGIKNKITNVLKKYGYNSEPYTISNAHTFETHKCFSIKHTWCFKPIATFLRENIGTGARNKHLPYWWHNTTSKFRWGILSGLIDTDGTVTMTETTKPVVSYSTTSETLAYGVSALINSLGGASHVYVYCRKSGTVEWRVDCGKSFFKQLKNNLELYNDSKKSNLTLLPSKSSDDDFDYTPNISCEKLIELRNKLSYTSNTKFYQMLSEMIRHAKENNYYGGYYRRDKFLKELKNNIRFIQNDPYWTKLIKIIEDDNIKWDIIKNIVPINITEAYDLTTPPYCTFVLQNGIIVYDTVSLNVVYTEESIQEIKQLLSSAKYYLTPEGTMAYSANDDVIDLVLSHMTDEPSKVNISKEDNLAKEFPKDASVQAKFSDRSLMDILGVLRYLGIRSKIPVEDFHITLFHSDKPFIYNKSEKFRHFGEIEKIDNVGNNVALIIKSPSLKLYSLTLSNGEQSSVPLHVDILYGTRYSPDILAELNAKLNAYKPIEERIVLDIDREILVESSEK